MLFTGFFSCILLVNRMEKLDALAKKTEATCADSNKKMDKTEGKTKKVK